MRRRSQAGFSLVETLVSMAIFALIGMLTYATFARQVEARQRAEAITSRYHQVRQAMQRMATEISMAYITAHRDCDEKRTQTLFKGDRISVAFSADGIHWGDAIPCPEADVAGDTHNNAFWAPTLSRSQRLSPTVQSDGKEDSHSKPSKEKRFVCVLS